MVFIYPLLDGSCSEMLALDNNLENEKSFDESIVGNSKGSCWLSSSINTQGSSFDVPPLSKFKRTSNIKFSNNIFCLYHVVGTIHSPCFAIILFHTLLWKNECELQFCSHDVGEHTCMKMG
jgi:hypothetical protein